MPWSLRPHETEVDTATAGRRAPVGLLGAPPRRLTRAASASDGPVEVVAADREKERLYRIREVARETGLPPSTIHLYVRQDVLPRPRKTSENQALYDQEFVDRAKLVKEAFPSISKVRFTTSGTRTALITW